jgi:hypothetical protein
MDHDLAHCILKLNRAEKVLHEVKDAINAFLASGFFEISPDVDRQGRLIGRSVDVRQPDAAISVLVGECAYHYRSALDHLAYRLATLHSGDPLPSRLARTSAFPIFSSGPDFRRRTKAGAPATGSGIHRIQGVSPSARRTIDSLQPYHKRRNPDARALLLLDELCNVDKHRSLHVTAAMLVGSQFRISGTGFFELHSIEVFPRPIVERAMLARFTGRFEGDVAIEANLASDVVFARDTEARTVRGRSVLLSLVEIREYLAFRVMPELSGFFPGEYEAVIGGPS